MLLRIASILVFAGVALGQPDSVLVVVNQKSAISRSIGDYYALRRKIPLSHICQVQVSVEDEISRKEYDVQIAAPIAAFLRAKSLQEKILYIVTTSGVPLRVSGSGSPEATDTAAVDSELTLLYGEMKGLKHALNGYRKNPFYGATGIAFAHPAVPLYLVTRLTGFDFADVKGLIDRSLMARNRGKFVLDLKLSSSEPGNDWLRQAARLLPSDRVIVDETAKVLLDQKDVIGYASWGSNDSNRKQRHLGFKWLPGAIMTEFVSTNARTFRRPPDDWDLGTWADRKTWFAGAPQTLTADYLHDGVTGASGHVAEPFLTLTPRPDLLLPAYFQGRNLAESYYLAIPGLSWMNVVVGDPLCSIGKAR